MTPLDTARCRGRQDTPAECAGCLRWLAARETLAQARTADVWVRVPWVEAPREVPCPVRIGVEVEA